MISWMNTSESALAPSVAICVTTCMLVLGASIAPVSAQQPSSDELDRFKALVKEGSELRDDGQHRKALEKFDSARQILDHPKLTFNIGKLRQKIGACDRAKQTYTDVLARPKLSDELRVQVVDQLDSVETCKSFGTLHLTCSPAEAHARIDTETLDCPLRKDIEAGEIQVEVSASGHDTATLEIVLEGGQLLEKHVQLQPAEMPVASVGDQTEGPTPWMTYTAYGAIGVGGAMLLGGIASDYSAQSRAEDFVAANRAGNRGQAQTLKTEAESAQARTVALYSVGALLVGGGVALWVYDAGEESDEAPRVSTEIGWAADAPAVRGVFEW